MKFYPLLPGMEPADLTEEYRASREIGSIRIGREHFFFRVRLKVWYIPYGRIRRCYRRVLLIPATVCCGKGELQAENLVLHGEEGELVQIPLPSTRAAKELMRELQSRIPGCIFAAPTADGGNK